MKELILNYFDLPRYIILRGKSGQQKVYEVKQSRKFFGIGLNTVPALTKDEERMRRSIRR